MLPAQALKLSWEDLAISFLALGFCCRASSSEAFARLKSAVSGNGGGFKVSENDGRAYDESSSYRLDSTFSFFAEHPCHVADEGH